MLLAGESLIGKAKTFNVMCGCAEVGALVVHGGSHNKDCCLNGALRQTQSNMGGVEYMNLLVCWGLSDMRWRKVKSSAHE